MKLLRARVQNYRSIKDSGWFRVEPDKTILVGTNESGKTAIFRALQTLNPPEGEGVLEDYRDYPRSDYGRIQRGEIKPEEIPVASGVFAIDDELKGLLRKVDSRFASLEEVTVTRYLANNARIQLGDVPGSVKWKSVEKRFARIQKRVAALGPPSSILATYQEATDGLSRDDFLLAERATNLSRWLADVRSLLTPEAVEILNELTRAVDLPTNHAAARQLVVEHLPVFVYYSSITTLRPRINLALLAERMRTGDIDPMLDAGNVSLFKLVGLDPGELSRQGSVSVKGATSHEDAEQVQIELAKRRHAFEEAAKDLTAAVKRVWGKEARKLAFRSDGDYVSVVVVEDDGDIELDQRSAGFVWLVSFYVVFKAEASDNLSNAILLLDEPGLSLHALKQQQFRQTVSMIAEDNQTLYTTHSPFMVGPDDLGRVRVVEQRARKGTKVHEQVTGSDPDSLFPLQAALGYNLAQSLFAQQKNLVCEGLTDYWYLEAVSHLLRDGKRDALSESVAIVPAGGARQVVYFASILHAQRLKVAALLDSDPEGESAATEDEFVRLIGKKRIHRTGSYLSGLPRSRSEDLLRETLTTVAKSELGWDVTATTKSQTKRPIGEIFSDEISGFSKYKLAKAFVNWTATHDADDLTEDERKSWETLFTAINKSLA